jgi:Transposase DDE domain
MKHMLTTHLRKFTALYEIYGLGAVKNLWLMIALLNIGRTTNLNKLKDYVGPVLGNQGTKPESHYQRLIRFFRDHHEQAGFVSDLQRLGLASLKKSGFRKLIMDGTSWSVGDAKVHYMVLAVLVGKVAVPIYWKQLGKLGASNQDERKELFECAAKLLDLSGMTLLADREYIGRNWFKYLKTNQIDFVIRMKMGDYIAETNAMQGKSYQQMLEKCLAKNKLVKKQILLDGCSFLLVMLPNPKHGADEKVVIMLTTLVDAKRAVRLYSKRWKIETMFKHLKTNGYNLEDLNMFKDGKLDLMMALVALAYIMTIKLGLKDADEIRLNKYKDGNEVLEVSVFRNGLALITSFCFDIIEFAKYVLANFYPKRLMLKQNVQ